VLCGKHVRAERPSFCPVCDKGREGSEECLFYQIDSKLAHEGKLPAQYDKMTRQFFAKRYAILKERAETHLHKHVASNLIDRHGEEEALRRLEKTGVICSGYIYDFDIEERVVLSRNDVDFSLEPRRIVRIIGIEPKRPFLSCISEQASVMDVSNNKEKLIIVGNFEMMLNCWSRSYDANHRIKQNFPRKLAKLVDTKYGEVVQTTSILSY
jgi:hypothetical protein